MLFAQIYHCVSNIIEIPFEGMRKRKETLFPDAINTPIARISCISFSWFAFNHRHLFQLTVMKLITSFQILDEQLAKISRTDL